MEENDVSHDAKTSLAIGTKNQSSADGAEISEESSPVFLSVSALAKHMRVPSQL
jgi:hypothetical protein